MKAVKEFRPQNDIEELNATVARRFGPDAIDILRVLPVDFTNPRADASDDRKIFAILLAGIAQLARDLDGVDLIQAIVRDGADGTFDGLEDGDRGRPITPRGAQRAMTADTVRERLAAAIERIQVSDSNITGVRVPPAILRAIRLGGASDSTPVIGHQFISGLPGKCVSDSMCSTGQN